MSKKQTKSKKQPKAASKSDPDVVPLTQAMPKKAKGKAAEKKLSCLDAAAQVLKSKGEPMNCKGMIDAMFANSTNETRTQTESALAQMQIKQLGDINFIANAIVGAVLFTLLFLTANTMMQSVRERTSELAVLKTLGFSDEKVLALVLIEAILLCVLAALAGLALASTTNC